MLRNATQIVVDVYLLSLLIMMYLCTVCSKKVFPKDFAIFLATAWNFYRNFTYLLLIGNHIKLLSSTVLFLTVTKLLNFLCDHVVISDVHGMFAEQEDASYFVTEHIKFVVI